MTVPENKDFFPANWLENTHIADVKSATHSHNIFTL